MPLWPPASEKRLAAGFARSITHLVFARNPGLPNGAIGPLEACMGVLLSPPIGIGPRLKMRSSGRRTARGCSRVRGRSQPHRQAAGSGPYPSSST